MNDATPERWKPVPDWEGLYEASALGRARSLPRMAMTGRAGMKLRPGRILKPYRNPRGYLYVNFSRPGFRQTFQVHVLVMLTFAGPCPEGKQVRHLNGVPDDNRWAPGDDEAQVIAAGGNLIYGTPRKNAEDRDKRHGTNHELNRTHCPQGHPYDEKNTYVAPNGWRQCRTCRAGHLAKYNASLSLGNSQYTAVLLTSVNVPGPRPPEPPTSVAFATAS